MVKQLNQMLESMNELGGTLEMVAIIVFLILIGGGIIALMVLSEIKEMKRIKHMFQIDDFKNIWDETYNEYYNLMRNPDIDNVKSKILETRKNIFIHAAIIGGELSIGLLELNTKMIDFTDNKQEKFGVQNAFYSIEKKILSGDYRLKFTSKQLKLLKEEHLRF
jgi:hypothetical protein